MTEQDQKPRTMDIWLDAVEGISGVVDAMDLPTPGILLEKIRPSDDCPHVRAYLYPRTFAEWEDLRDRFKRGADWDWFGDPEPGQRNVAVRSRFRANYGAASVEWTIAWMSTEARG